MTTQELLDLIAVKLPSTGLRAIKALNLREVLNAIVNNTSAGDGKREYIALLLQSLTDAPVAVVLKNTLGGEVVWTRESIGYYEADLSEFGVTNENTLFNGKAPWTGDRNVMEIVGNTPEVTAFLFPYTWDGKATIEVVNSDNAKIDLSEALGGTAYAVKIEIFN